MQSLDKRIAALEAVYPANPFRLVRLKVGETEEAGRLRCGIPTDATNLLFIQRVIIAPRKSTPC